MSWNDGLSTEPRRGWFTDYSAYFDGRACLFRANSCYRDEINDTVQVSISAYFIMRYTPKGAWISMGGEHSPKKHWRFVNLTALRQWACVTREEAFNQLKHRKRRQIQIINSQLDVAEQTLSILAEQGFK